MITAIVLIIGRVRNLPNSKEIADKALLEYADTVAVIEAGKILAANSGSSAAKTHFNMQLALLEAGKKLE